MLERKAGNPAHGSGGSGISLARFKTLAIYFPSVSNPYYQDLDGLVLNVTDQPVITDPVFPKPSQFRPV